MMAPRVAGLLALTPLSGWRVLYYLSEISFSSTAIKSFQITLRDMCRDILTTIWLYHDRLSSRPLDSSQQLQIWVVYNEMKQIAVCQCGNFYSSMYALKVLEVNNIQLRK